MTFILFLVQFLSKTKGFIFLMNMFQTNLLKGSAIVSNYRIQEIVNCGLNNLTEMHLFSFTLHRSKARNNSNNEGRMREENTENNQLKLNHTYEPDFEDNKAIPGVCSRWTRG